MRRAMPPTMDAGRRGFGLRLTGGLVAALGLGTGALAGLGGCAATPPAEGRLAVEESLLLPDVAPEAVWSVIGDFGALDWHPVVARTVVHLAPPTQAGAQREITTRDGAVLVEALDGRDVDAHLLRYHIVRSPLPVSGYHARLQVLAVGRGSRVVWSSRFDRDPQAAGVDDAQARAVIAGIYRAGFDGLKARFGA